MSGSIKDSELKIMRLRQRRLFAHGKGVISDFSGIAFGCSWKHMRLQRLQISSVLVPADLGGGSLIRTCYFSLTH